MLQSLALLLGLGVAQAARPSDHYFQSVDDLVEVSPEEFAALGGEADCPVTFQVDASSGVIRIRVGACPDGVVDCVQKAAESWTVQPGRGAMSIVGIVKVRH